MKRLHRWFQYAVSWSAALSWDWAPSSPAAAREFYLSGIRGEA